MKIESKIKLAQAATIAASATIIFLSVLTIAADILPALKTWLVSTFSHHWLGKSYLSIGGFLILWLLAYLAKIDANEFTLVRALRILYFIVIFCVIILFVFFAYETLK